MIPTVLIEMVWMLDEQERIWKEYGGVILEVGTCRIALPGAYSLWKDIRQNKDIRHREAQGEVERGGRSQERTFPGLRREGLPPDRLRSKVLGKLLNFLVSFFWPVSTRGTH